MKWIKENNKSYKWISTFPSDTPFFTKKELNYFYENIKKNDSKLFFIKNKDTRHNIFGLWSLDLINQLEKDLLKGERKVEVWADSIGVSTVNIEYKKPALLEDQLTVRSFVKSITKTSFFMNQIITKGEEIIVEAQVHLVFVSKEGKPVKIPEEIYSKFKPYFCDTIKT